MPKALVFIMTAISLLIVFVLLFPLKRGEVTVGMFTALAASALNLVQMLSWELANSMSEIAKNREYLKDLTAFANLSETCGALDLLEKEAVFESLEFRHVSFRYPGTEQEILKDFNLRIEKGRHYAFVGVNGAGKTTITKLLTGLYEEYEGDILLNGRNLRNFTQAQIKAFFSVVCQDFARYQIPMEDNIALRNVLERQEGGADLSGGQWQRIAIARGFFRSHSLIILDEPTAAIDPYEETRLYNQFAEISREKSAVIVTHRLGSVRLADRILVMKQGHACQLGTHEELLAEEDGEYKRLYESQERWYQEGEGCC